MSLKRVLLDDELLKSLLVEKPSPSLADAVHALIQHQAVHWPELKKVRESLAQIIVRKIFLESLEVTLQFNPGRIVSAGAPVDRESINRRPCFLCVHNLPAEQRGLLYKEEWLILNNPAPLFPDHLVISHRDHRPQMADAALPAMIALVTDLQFSFSAFYNGPACGASAPDHLHFQMCPDGEIPLVSQIHALMGIDSGKQVLTVIDEGREGTCCTGYPDRRAFFICKTGSPSFLLERLTRALQLLPVVPDVSPEPLVNLIIAGRKGCYYGILFPRKAHRPACYFRDGAGKMLISPGAVDVGGLIILPRKEDFASITREMVLAIFQEVCQGPEVFAGLAIRGS